MAKSPDTLIFLVGFMGSGKTTWGKTLARALGYDYIDLDHAIEKQVGLSVAKYFSVHGEAAFRQMEKNTLRALATSEKTVVATGGGTPCYLENMAWMNAHGKTIYLQLTPAAILSRLSQSEQDKRPLLKDKTPDEMLQFIENKLMERAPYYEQATYTINALRMKIDELINLLPCAHKAC